MADKPQLPARRTNQLPARGGLAGPPAPRRHGGVPAKRSKTSAVQTSARSIALFKRIFGSDAEKLIERMQSTFTHINTMSKEDVCAAARSLRILAHEADMYDDIAVDEMLEAMRLRMIALWISEHGALWYNGDYKVKNYDARLQVKEEYDSALGRDIERGRVKSSWLKRLSARPPETLGLSIGLAGGCAFGVFIGLFTFDIMNVIFFALISSMTGAILGIAVGLFARFVLE